MSKPELTALAKAWPIGDQYGYDIKLCTCEDGAHIGARQMGIPDCCERCGFMTPAQWDHIAETIDADTMRKAADVGYRTLDLEVATGELGAPFQRVRIRVFDPARAARILASDWLRDHDAALTVKAKAEGLREAADYDGSGMYTALPDWVKRFLRERADRMTP